MLGTLIKHEFRYIIKTFSPLYLVYLLIALAVRILSTIADAMDPGETNSTFDILPKDPTLSTILVAFTCVAAIFGIFSAALPFLSVVDNIRRFHRNMFTDEGYLTNTLPVTATEHVAAKLISGAANYLVCLIVLILGMLITGGSETIEIINEMWEGLISNDIPFNEKMGAFLIVIMGYVSFILYGYLITAFNSMTNSKGCLTAVIVFFSITLGISFLSRLLAALMINIHDEDLAMYIISGVLLVLSALFWWLLTFILNKHLNLQ